jgi:ATP-dependent DNA helicase RecG
MTASAPARQVTAPRARGFASSEPIRREDLLAAPLRSVPHPSLLLRELELPRRAREAAAGLGIVTAGDLLEHLPHSHRDRRETRSVAELRIGEEATVAAVVREVGVRPTRDGRRRRVEARVADASGTLLAVWFNQGWIARQLVPGSAVLLHGRLRRRGELWVSDHELVADAGAAGLHTLGLVPVYPAGQGITAERLREAAWAAAGLARHTVEPLPAALRVAERLADRAAALAAAHFPSREEEAAEGRRRLAFEELLLLELALATRRRSREDAGRAERLPATGTLVDPWLTTLPFAPTGDQRSAFSALDRDLDSERPMNRLLMGEVGSGKTVVALHAMLRAVEGRRQAALMAPTETLAEQHLLTLDRLLGGLVPIALLTGSTPAARRREIVGMLASGELSLVVGTHALIEPDVGFRALAVAVVDEQHRFGVRQRAALDAKGRSGLLPHVLHMTATPIPRTLELTVYGDMDSTVLRDLPAGRRPVETFVVAGAAGRARAYERVREEVAQGRQCFVVCPLVEESEALQATAARAEAERLAVTEFRDLRVALIHGQLGARQKADAMQAFASGEAHVLVATSVIEVGIDVPNASVMLVEDAARYGISQLHQLRGRVGRGGHPSLCILFGDPGLPRLRAVALERDGFRLAEVDLELRGAGDVLGTRQHGLPQFRVARLPEDLELLSRARRAADELLARDPDLRLPEHLLLGEAAAARYGPQTAPIPG